MGARQEPKGQMDAIHFMHLQKTQSAILPFFEDPNQEGNAAHQSPCEQSQTWDTVQSGHLWKSSYVGGCESSFKGIDHRGLLHFSWRRDVREGLVAVPAHLKNYHVGKYVLSLAVPQRFQGRQVFQSETQLPWQTALPLPFIVIGK